MSNFAAEFVRLTTEAERRDFYTEVYALNVEKDHTPINQMSIRWRRWYISIICVLVLTETDRKAYVRPQRAPLRRTWLNAVSDGWPWHHQM